MDKRNLFFLQTRARGGNFLGFWDFLKTLRSQITALNDYIIAVSYSDVLNSEDSEYTSQLVDLQLAVQHVCANCDGSIQPFTNKNLSILILSWFWTAWSDNTSSDWMLDRLLDGCWSDLWSCHDHRHTFWPGQPTHAEMLGGHIKHVYNNI